MNKKYLLYFVTFSVLFFTCECGVHADSIIGKDSVETDCSLIATMTLLSSQIDSIQALVNTKINSDSVESTFKRLHNDISSLRSEINEEILRLSTIHTQSISETTDELERLARVIQETNDRVDELRNTTVSNSDSISATNNTMQLTKSATDEHISGLNNKLSDRSLYMVLGLFGLLLIIVLVFIAIRSRHTKQTTALNFAISETRDMLDKEGVKLDTKLVTILKQQLDSQGQERFAKDAPDHTLPLKLGEEIHRMRKRLANMDSTRDVKVLQGRIESLEQQLNKMGYDIIDLEGRQYIDGMTVRARFVVDDNLEEGQNIITRVIVPQINFNDVLIQSAEVEVSRRG